MKKRIISILVLACMMCLLLAGCQSGKSGGNVASEARSGVVRLLTVDQYGNMYVGSAFGVGEAGKETIYFVTNYHVVSDEYGDAVEAVYILKDNYAYGVAGLDLSRMVPCDIIYRDDNGSPDLAVIRAAETVPGRVALPLMPVEGKLNPGDTVYALGYPASADYTTTGLLGAVEDVTITNGIVSRIAEYAPMENTRLIQHTAPINGGNSGGPLINEKGAVVGVNTLYFNANGISGGEVNHFGSIEAEYVMDMLDGLRDVKYDVYSDGGISLPLVIGLAVVALVIIAVVVIVLVTRKPVPPPVSGGPMPGPMPGSGPSSGPAFTPPPGPGPAQPPARPVIAGDTGLRIQGVTGHFAGRRFAIAGQLRIGRDPARNDLVYPADSQGVSGVHCVLMVEGGRLLLKDLGSTYGTFVGGNRLAANAPSELQVGDRFCLGSERETFVVARKGES